MYVLMTFIPDLGTEDWSLVYCDISGLYQLIIYYVIMFISC